MPGERRQHNPQNLTPIEELNLPQRHYNWCKRQRFDYIEQFNESVVDQLITIHTAGPKIIEAITGALEIYNKRLAPQEQEQAKENE